MLCFSDAFRGLADLQKANLRADAAATAAAVSSVRPWFAYIYLVCVFFSIAEWMGNNEAQPYLFHAPRVIPAYVESLRVFATSKIYFGLGNMRCN